MKCQFCDERCIKKGKRNGKQRYRCTLCQKNQYCSYKHKKYTDAEKQFIVKLTNEEMSIRSISRILNIPKTSVGRLLLKQSKKIKNSHCKELGEEYEVDELRTFVGRKDKECWICYAINRKTKQVVDFIVGRRIKKNLKKIIDTLLKLNPKRIFTDKLNSYPSLIPQSLHSTKFRGTNYIERNNLTLRTHLKRLSKKTICFSRSEAMLTACLALYFWR